VTVRRALDAAAARLAAAGLPSARAEAFTLVSHVLGVPVSRLALVPGLSAEQAAALEVVLDRRVAGEPVQYITGIAPFRTTTVTVGPGVFIPRPETECLAGWAIDVLRFRPGRAVELCAGSGAVAKALVLEAAPSRVWAVERSAAAFAYLTANLAGTGVTPVLADMAVALPELDGTIDLVVANPPYLVRSVPLPPDVYADPAEALYADGDPLDAIRTVATVAARLLVPGGVVGCEHGDDQSGATCAIFTGAGFTDVTAHTDLVGRPRFVTARWPMGDMMKM